MTPPLTETVFIGIIASMLLVMVGLHGIARFNSKRRSKRSAYAVEPASANGAKIIPLPQNAMKQSKERFLVEDSVSEEEII